MRRWVLGTGVALGVSFPAVVIAQVIWALNDEGDGLSATVRSVLVLLLLAGSVVGGAVIARRRLDVVPAAVGATDLTLVALLGLVLRSVRDEATRPEVVPALAVVGALLGILGWLIGTVWTGRTRR